ncbi:MAG: hypothetical protein QM779_00725 [Propionicimonas sp.]|uniref:hypothetical protein n=1 Tax=Propionicimonas sp. TaxID=1955623 RepID=UPI003D11C907
MTQATFRVEGSSVLARRLARLVDAAQSCVARNIVPGRGAGEPAYLRAGGGYADPWTRDAAINTWQAGSWLFPQVSRDTLTMVCERDGSAVVWDTQWWDQVSWLVGARQLAVVTGDRGWASRALEVGKGTFARLDQRCLGPDGLYRGPAVMADGITGYPPSLHDPARAGDSFVLDHAATHRIRCLSTNALHVLALRCLADLAEASGRSGEEWRGRAEALAALVRDRFWISAENRFGYLLPDPAADTAGAAPSREQEGLGLALAILAGVADPAQARASVAGAWRTPHGLPAVWPAFDGFDEHRFGRHGTALWPMVMGVWAQAVAASGDAVAFGTELEALCALFEGSGREFFEVYHPFTGVADGGWQAGRWWRSEPDQTWSATAFLGTVLHGLAGLRPCLEGLRLAPCPPPGAGRVELVGLPWRGSRFNLVLDGSGSRVAEVLADGHQVPADQPVVDAAVPHTLEVHCTEEAHG